MSIITRAEFATICNRTILVINTNISRGKISVLKHDKSLIDTENVLNVIFKKKCQGLDKGTIINPNSKKAKEDKAKTIKLEDIPKHEPYPIKPESVVRKKIEKAYGEVVEKYTAPESEYEKNQRLKQNEEDSETVDWDRRKKIADTLKAEKQAELSNLQVEKMMGNLMPVDMVEQIIKVNLQDIFKTFENETINIASIYCDILAGGDRAKLSELINKLRHALSATIKKAEQVAAQEIENVINEYSESRNRGEKK